VLGPTACCLLTSHAIFHPLSSLITVLSRLVHRPVVSSNISAPAFFRIIEELNPTLLIDEADTNLRGSDELRGILNAGYSKPTAFVWRVACNPLPQLSTRTPARTTARTPGMNPGIPMSGRLSGRLSGSTLNYLTDPKLACGLWTVDRDRDRAF